MVVLVILSTLALLAGVDDGRARWWAANAACACAAVYTHYTAVGALGAQLLWLLWAHPEYVERRSSRASGQPPGSFRGCRAWWLGPELAHHQHTGVLQPFTLDRPRISLEHWSVGYPFPAVRLLFSLPGDLGPILIALGVAAAIVGVLLSRNRRFLDPARAPPLDATALGPSSPAVVTKGLVDCNFALAAPVGIAVVSAFSTDTLAARALAVPLRARARGAARLGPRSRFASPRLGSRWRA